MHTPNWVQLFLPALVLSDRGRHGPCFTEEEPKADCRGLTAGTRIPWRDFKNTLAGPSPRIPTGLVVWDSGTENSNTLQVCIMYSQSQDHQFRTKRTHAE